jgi:hypothetical protein
MNLKKLCKIYLNRKFWNAEREVSVVRIEMEDYLNVIGFPKLENMKQFLIPQIKETDAERIDDTF